MSESTTSGTDLPTPPRPGDLTYNTYLKVSELLSLQHPQSDPQHHDEMLFIIIHQAYELWFKLILHELDFAIRYMGQARVLRARHFVNRVVEIMRLLVPQIHILETMTPAEFLQFRDRLDPASGFQSIQFRELEFMAGLKDARYLRFFDHVPQQKAQLERRLSQPDLRDAYYAMLRGMDFDLPEDISREALVPGSAAEQQVLQALVPIYQDPERSLPLYLLSESLVDLDEHLALWREHHVRVVERIIGFKRGTGGSSGAAYLRSRTTIKCFPCLWDVRTLLEKIS